MLSEALTETKKVKRYALELGADVVAIANIDFLRGISTCIPNLFESFPRAVSIAVSVRKYGSSLSQIKNSYSKQIDLLESISLRISILMENKGFKTLVIHPRDHVNYAEEIGLISNKAVAKTAGIGWLGKSLLLVTPKYGPRVRLVSVLTNMPLVADKPLRNQCGDCQMCVASCPEQALKNVKFVDHPNSREEVLQIQKCRGHRCLVCMLVCPVGKEKRQNLR